jgi:DNA-directed RNA polymerase beta subunit
MGGQAVGVYNSNHMYRYDSAVQKLLAFPSIPVFRSQMYEPLGMNRLGSGESVILAMLTNMNLTEEDAVMVSQRAVDAGFGLMVYYNTITDNITIDKSGITEEFTRSIPQKLFRVGNKNPYRHLDENGIVRVGSTLEVGDCAIGKIKRYDNESLDQEEIKDSSSYVKKGDEGTVISVIQDGNTVTVKTYAVYNQIVGNKLATRHAQKGTIGTIYPPDKMMRFEDGSTPDIVMNTHAIPSRMTLGQLIEMLVGKSSLFSGQYVDSTAYNDFDINDFIRILKSYGHNEWGWQVMVNGLTGEKFKALVFSGPVFYQILKHQVKDKAQVRSRGAKSELTGQPVAGKARGGGLRFGYQEKDAMLSHGAMGLMREIFMESSDKKPCMICKNCNNTAYIDVNGIFQCRTCTGDTKPVMVELPNSQHITSNLLTAAGVYTQVIPTSD